MELTAWQKICHRILGRAFKKKARGDAKLSDDLLRGTCQLCLRYTWPNYS